MPYMIRPLPSSPIHLPPLLPAHSSPDSLDTLLFLQPARHAPTSGPLHLLFPLPGNVFSRYLHFFPPSPPSAFSSNATSSARPLLSTLFKNTNPGLLVCCWGSILSAVWHCVQSKCAFVQCQCHPEGQLLEHRGFCLLFTFCPSACLAPSTEPGP